MNSDFLDLMILAGLDILAAVLSAGPYIILTCPVTKVTIVTACVFDPYEAFLQS